MASSGALRAARSPATGRFVLFVQTTRCFEGGQGGHLYRYSTRSPFLPWVRVDSSAKLPGGIDSFAVDANNANRLFVVNICAGSCPASSVDAEGRMMSSSNGGATWEPNADLDRKMTGMGLVTPGEKTFKFVSHAKVLSPFTASFGRRAQPTLVAFGPYDPQILVAGARDAGVFLSINGGKHWQLVTDPVRTGSFDVLRLFGRPHIPRPYFAHFKHDSDGVVWIYLGTQGRGVWRLRVVLPGKRGISLGTGAMPPLPHR